MATKRNFIGSPDPPEPALDKYDLIVLELKSLDARITKLEGLLNTEDK